MVEPFLNHSFAVAACDTYNRYVELIAMTLSKSLQGSEGVFHNKEIGTFIFWLSSVNDKIAHTTIIQFFDVLMTVIALCTQGEKESLLWKRQRTTISKKERDVSFCVTYTSRSNECDNLVYRIFH